MKKGQKVNYVVTEFGRTRKFPAVITEVHADHMIVNCPGISDHLWIDEDYMDMIEERVEE